jgi:aminopeptidase N
VKLPGARWYHPNAGARGFYRYALDDASVDRLARAVRELDAGERLMLIDNQWALTRAGKAELRQLFALIAALRGERDRAVLDSISGPIGWLWTHAVGDPQRPTFQAFVRDYFTPRFEELGWDARPDDSSDDRELRASLIGMLGRIAGVPALQDEARRRVQAHLEGGARLDPDVAGPAVRVAATRGDPALYDRYVDRMKQAAGKDAQEEGRFRDGLTAFEDEAIARRTAEGCFGGLVRVQDMGLLLVSLLGGRHSRRVTWPIVRDHWDGDIAPLEALLKSRVITGLAQLTPGDLATEAEAFLREKQLPDTMEVTAQALERLRLDSASAARLSGQLASALEALQGEP